MGFPSLELADLFRLHGEDYRKTYRPSRRQQRVMRAIERCRTAALGGHVEQCEHCARRRISYNSCRNRHCPKCQSSAKAAWLDARRKELLPVPYFHVVFTLPHTLAPIALQNPRTVYRLLFQAVSQTLLLMASDPRHLGASIGFLAILHTWGQNLMHHPHIHCVVPAGGLSSDGLRWVACRSRFLFPVRVLSRLFRRLFLELLEQAFEQDRLSFHGLLEGIAEPRAFRKLLHSARKREWVVYSKPPFGTPETVLDYLARYTHRIAVSNHRLIGFQDQRVTFSLKDYRKGGAKTTLTLHAHEFIRRFLLHVLPRGFVRIRYYGFLANRHRAENLQTCRCLLAEQPIVEADSMAGRSSGTGIAPATGADPSMCPFCKQGKLFLVETFSAATLLRGPPQRTPR